MRSILTTLAFFASIATSNAAITFLVNTNDVLSGNFQVDLGSQETQLGVTMPELDSLSLDGVSSPAFMSIFTHLATPDSDFSLVEYLDFPGQNPAIVSTGNETGIILAGTTGGRAINYAFTNVSTDASTIVGEFEFTAVPEPSSYALILGSALLTVVIGRRRRSCVGR